MNQPSVQHHSTYTLWTWVVAILLALILLWMLLTLLLIWIIKFLISIVIISEPVYINGFALRLEPD